jgi:hypothetical protein
VALVRKRTIPTERPPLVGEVPTIADRGVLRGRGVTDPHAVFPAFLDGSRYFSIKQLLRYTHEAEWTPFQTHYFSENLVAPGIEPGSSGFVDH